MSYSADPALYLYTSLTSGSSHIVTATSRLETILRANRVPFKALDIATDEKARMLWGRRAGKDEGGRVRKLPGLVQEGMVLGDLVEIEDWNEYGELKMHIKIVPVDGPGAVKQVVPATQPAKSTPVSNAPTSTPSQQQPPRNTSSTAPASKDNEPPMSAVGGVANAFTATMRQAGQEAAQKAKDALKTVKALSAIGTAEPVEKPQSSPKITAPVSAIAIPHIIDAVTLMQDTETGTWSRALGKLAPPEQAAFANCILRVDSLQSPTSTAWKPVSSQRAGEEEQLPPPPPVLTHAGSEVAPVSTETIQKVEADQTIPEEAEL